MAKPLTLCGPIFLVSITLTSCLGPAGRNNQMEYEYEAPEMPQQGQQQGASQRPVEMSSWTTGPRPHVNSAHQEYEALEIQQPQNGAANVGAAHTGRQNGPRLTALQQNPNYEYEAPEIQQPQNGAANVGAAHTGRQNGPRLTVPQQDPNYEYEAPEIPSSVSNNQQSRTLVQKSIYSAGQIGNQQTAADNNYNQNGQTIRHSAGAKTHQKVGNRNQYSIHTSSQSNQHRTGGSVGTSLYNRGKIMKGLFKRFRQIAKFYNYDMAKVRAALRQSALNYAKTVGAASGIDNSVYGKTGGTTGQNQVATGQTNVNQAGSSSGVNGKAEKTTYGQSGGYQVTRTSTGGQGSGRYQVSRKNDRYQGAGSTTSGQITGYQASGKLTTGLNAGYQRAGSTARRQSEGYQTSGTSTTSQSGGYQGAGSTKRQTAGYQGAESTTGGQSAEYQTSGTETTGQITRYQGAGSTSRQSVGYQRSGSETTSQTGGYQGAGSTTGGQSAEYQTSGTETTGRTAGYQGAGSTASGESVGYDTAGKSTTGGYQVSGSKLVDPKAETTVNDSSVVYLAAGPKTLKSLLDQAPGAAATGNPVVDHTAGNEASSQSVLDTAATTSGVGKTAEAASSGRSILYSAAAAKPTNPATTYYPPSATTPDQSAAVVAAGAKTSPNQAAASVSQVPVKQADGSATNEIISTFNRRSIQVPTSVENIMSKVPLSAPMSYPPRHSSYPAYYNMQPSNIGTARYQLQRGRAINIDNLKAKVERALRQKLQELTRNRSGKRYGTLPTL